MAAGIIGVGLWQQHGYSMGWRWPVPLGSFVEFHAI